MKKILIFSLFSVLSLTANTQYSMANAYFNEGGVFTDRLKVLVEKDDLWKNGNEFIVNPDKMKKELVNKADPESKNRVDIKSESMPDWNRAYYSFKESALSNNNPLSAYQALSIMESYFPITAFIKDYKQLSTILYSQEKNICKSYLYMANVYYKGYGSRVNKQQAKQIWLEAKNNKACENGWHKNILESKLKLVK